VQFGDLEALQAAVETGSLSAAARRLRSSQPGMSRRLQRLEADLGVQLLVRTPGGVEPTAAGARIARRAEEVLAAVAALRAEAQQTDVPLTGVVCLVSSTTPGDHLVPSLVAGFTHDHPGVRVDVRTADSAAVLDAVLDREADIGFTGRRVPHARLGYLPVAADEVVLVVPSDHRLAAAGAVPLPALEGARLVWRERGSGTQQAFLDAVEAAGRTLPPGTSGVTVGSGSAVVAAVRAGSGVGVASLRAVEAAPGVVPVRILGIPVLRQLWLVHETDRPQPAHVRAFLASVAQYVRARPPQ
jgi:DNA-binding transcriptional LysR family regulator